MGARTLAALAWCFALGCADELERGGDDAVVVVGGDAGPTRIEGPSSSDELRPLPHPECADGCPQPCSLDEACCASTQTCVRLDCRECCPDASFGTVTLRRAFADR